MAEREESWRSTQEEAARLVRSLGLVPLPSGDQDRTGTTNRIVRCRDFSGRDLVARVRPRWMTEERIRFEHALAAHLFDGGLPMILPLRLAGTPRVDTSALFCDVYPFVTGRHGRPVPEELRLAGSLLGRFHVRSASFPRGQAVPAAMRNQATPGEIEAWLDSQLLAHIGVGAAFRKAVRSYARALHGELASVGPLPVVVRHGDYHLWNLLFAEIPLRVTALLDLDMAETGPRVYDVSYALLLIRHALAVAHGGSAGVAPWADAYGAFARGYASSGSPLLAPDEVRAVPAQMRCTALFFALANARHYREEPELAAVLEEEYLSVSRWLDAEWPALERIVVAPPA